MAETDPRGLPIEVGTLVIYLNSLSANRIKITEGEVIEILEHQYLIRRTRQWVGNTPWSYYTERPLAILKHKCLVVLKHKCLVVPRS